jgi:tetratricopeptide (TPR) repeat protein
MSLNGDATNRERRLASLDALRRAGRMDEAVAFAGQWTRAAPRDLAAWSALATLLFEATRPDLAAEAWARALAIDPASCAALCGGAKALAAMGRSDEATTFFRRALAANPEDFDARFGLALLAFDGGDLAGADALAMGLDAGRPGALWLTARISAARSDFARALSAVERMLAKEGLDDAQRAEALLLNAHILDQAGESAAAFAAAVEGKVIQRRLFAGRANSHEGETQKLERLAAWFAGADRSPWTTAPAPEPVPGQADGHVFLLGFPRSGTTLLEQALAGHPGVEALEEAPTLADPYHAFLKSAAGLERLAHITAEEARSWRARYWEVVRAFGGAPAGRVFLDKAPAETLSLPLIAKLFPSAKVLFAVRDPRDVVLSCFLNGFQMNAMTYAFTDLAETAACYGACMRLAEIYRDRLPLDLREVRYEALVDDFPGELASIAAFAGLEFDLAMVDVAATSARRVVRTPSAGQVRAGLNRQGLAHWRAYAAELAPAAETLAPWIKRFGYSERAPE